MAVSLCSPTVCSSTVCSSTMWLRGFWTFVAWGVVIFLVLLQVPALIHVPELLRQRALDSTSSWPPLLPTLVPLATLAAVALPFGFATGFLKPKLVRPPLKIVALGLVTFVAPGVFEEVIFRMAVLPPSTCDSLTEALTWNSALTMLAAVVAFVLYHLDVFHLAIHSEVRFLVIATALGVACTAAYCSSGGNLWSAVIVHWVPVWLWVCFFGGFEAHEAARHATSARTEGAGSLQSTDGSLQSPLL